VAEITLSTDEFALLYEYLDREHSIVWDRMILGQTTKLGKKLWDRIQEIAKEEGFTPTHTPIEGGRHNFWTQGAMARCPTPWWQVMGTQKPDPTAAAPATGHAYLNWAICPVEFFTTITTATG
jgi:hypothetical protein